MRRTPKSRRAWPRTRAWRPCEEYWPAAVARSRRSPTSIAADRRVGRRSGMMIGVMSPLDELAPGLWRLTVTRNGLPPTMTAYALRDGGDTILVDALVAGETEPLLAALDEIVRGRVRILVTTPFHVRGS